MDWCELFIMADPVFAAVRRKVRRLLEVFLPSDISYRIEYEVRWGIPNDEPNFERIYKQKIRSLLHTLRNNTALRQSVANYRVPVHTFLGAPARI